MRRENNKKFQITPSQTSLRSNTVLKSFLAKQNNNPMPIAVTHQSEIETPDSSLGTPDLHPP